MLVTLAPIAALPALASFLLARLTVLRAGSIRDRR